MRIVLVPIALTALAGCNFEVIHGNGTIRSEERAVPAFTKTKVAAPLATHVEPGEEAKVTLEADENLLGHLVVSVTNGTLHLEIDDPGTVLEPTAPMSATVIAANQDRVEATSSERVSVRGFAGGHLALVSSGEGGLTASELDVDTLDVELSGSGATTLLGEAGALLLTHSGSGDVKAGALAAESAHVELSGSGTTTISCPGQVDGSLSGSGDLVITGGPSRVDVEDSGSGAVSIR